MEVTVRQPALTVLSSLFCIRRQAIIVIPQAHVLAFSEECDITKEQSEAFLRKHGGDFKAALSAFIKGG